MQYISQKNYYIEINSSKIHTITSRSKYWNKFPTKQTNKHISIFLFLPIIKNKRSHTKLNKQTLLNIHLNFLSPYNLPRNKYPSPSTLSQSQRERDRVHFERRNAGRIKEASLGISPTGSRQSFSSRIEGSEACTPVEQHPDFPIGSPSPLPQIVNNTSPSSSRDIGAPLALPCEYSRAVGSVYRGEGRAPVYEGVDTPSPFPLDTLFHGQANVIWRRSEKEGFSLIVPRDKEAPLR